MTSPLEDRLRIKVSELRQVSDFINSSEFFSAISTITSFINKSFALSSSLYFAGNGGSYAESCIFLQNSLVGLNKTVAHCLLIPQVPINLLLLLSLTIILIKKYFRERLLLFGLMTLSFFCLLVATAPILLTLCLLVSYLIVKLFSSLQKTVTFLLSKEIIYTYLKCPFLVLILFKRSIS